MEKEIINSEDSSITSTSMILKENEKNVIDTIRRNGDLKTKNEISDRSETPWATVSNILDSLKSKSYIVSPNELNKDTYRLNSNAAYFAGVSIGSSKIKFVILDFNFKLIEKSIVDDWIYNLPDTEKKNYENLLEQSSHNIASNYNDNKAQFKLCLDCSYGDFKQISIILQNICNIICGIKKDKGINILSTCFVLPGHIDFNNQFIVDSYVFGSLNNLKSERFLTQRITDQFKKLNIQYCIDHNVKAAMIAEREIGNNFNINECDNLLMIYLGYGIGSSLIINNKLYRGNKNNAGQIGHIQVCPKNPKNPKNPSDEDMTRCRCGKRNCLEHRIRRDVFVKEDGQEFDLRKASPDELRNFLIDNSEKATLLAEYLSQAICNIFSILSIDKVILSGKLSYIFDLIKDELDIEMIENLNPTIEFKCSNLGEFSAAIGAALDGYSEYFKLNFRW